MTTTAAPLLEQVAPGVLRVSEHAAPAMLDHMIEAIARLDGDPQLDGPGNDIARVDQLTLLERLKAATAAAQARITQAFEQSQLSRQRDAADEARAAGLEAKAERIERDLGRGIGDQVALARGCSTSLGSRHLGFAKAMAEMPHTHDLLTRGQISEWVATLLVKETAILKFKDRAAVDQSLCATTVDTKTGEVFSPEVLGLTPRRAGDRARALGNELDPKAAVRRAAKSAQQRRVTIRPTPNTMTYVTGLLPVAKGVSVYANLKASAEAIKAGGDLRTINQLMADLFVERLTGQKSAELVPVEVGLVMTPDTLLGFSDRPARMNDGMPVPAQTARDLANQPGAPVWLRRIFTDPVTGVATDRDPRRRRHTEADKAFIRDRDQECRMPGCERLIDDIDHPVRHADGGESTRVNGQGLCEGHNLAKEAPEWRTRVSDPRPGGHEVEFITPTGHVYRSKAPPALPPDAERADLPPPA
ncbi:MULTISPECIES: HNH endonuclease [unclassified Nocardioides]|uniref:HNH endonuclease n=1 Tax=unclassified Nocardioides TaxID=2615069 RepID=UPI0006F85BDD|nr:MULTISPECIES: DUF222 domain-containing protein [unclassified Nocardioides]KQY64294.1 hypothetical protein ASD30_04945 [Nocardioides sp. Root140]KRF16310.1 hypothetical protein ASH02_06970 [Nocardioides sp. Soil796]